MRVAAAAAAGRRRDAVGRVMETGGGLRQPPAAVVVHEARQARLPSAREAAYTFHRPCPPVLDLARRLLALSQTGLHFTPEEYDRERYREIGDIAARLLELQSRAAAPTTVRQRLVRRGRLLRRRRSTCAARSSATTACCMVRERVDGKWTVPGGWADVNDSPTSRGGEGDRAGVRLHGARGQARRRLRSQQARSPAVPVPRLEDVLHLRDHRRRSRAPATRRLPSSSSRSTRCRSCRRAARPQRRSGACTSTICIPTCRPSSIEHVRTERRSRVVHAGDRRARRIAFRRSRRRADPLPVAGTPPMRHKPALLFAHGFRAHARWWSFIAPFFLEPLPRRLDRLRGHGRQRQPSRVHAARLRRATSSACSIMRVRQGDARRSQLRRRPRRARLRRGSERVSRAVIIDSHMRLTDEKRSTPRRSRSAREASIRRSKRPARGSDWCRRRTAPRRTSSTTWRVTR